MKLITLIIPAYNEEKSLPFLFKRLDNLVKNVDSRKYQLEFLFINDGSRDKTLSVLEQAARENPRISYLNFSRNFGKEIGVAAGLDHADGDAVVIMDADGQEPPELIPQMIEWWEKGYDDVYAQRTNRDNEGFLKRSLSHMYYRMVQKMSRVEIQIDTGDFRLFSRRCVLTLRQIRETSRQNKAIFSWIGYKKKAIKFIPDKRAAGQTKWKLGVFAPGNSLINLAIDGFTSFSNLPLRLISVFGLLVCFAAFIYIIIIMIQYFMGVPRSGGYNTMLIVILFLGGVQMVSLGVIGEYVGRIFTETKRRPLYLVETYHRAKSARKASRDPKKLDEMEP
jgi:glycosyltransferase involved in cell wall biosynthesis